MRIIFEIANNHQGKIDHFKKILNDIKKATKPYNQQFEFCIKYISEKRASHRLATQNIKHYLLLPDYL